jgi:iron complex outermembrane receptor protein
MGRTTQPTSSSLPNVKIAQSGATDVLNIRGVGSSLNMGFEQSVATFVDGLYRGRSRAIRSALFDVERVEVLKGPQTTFFGNNAIAGALNITTRKPADHLEANGTAFYAPGSGEYTLEAGASAPISDKLAVRIAGRASGEKGYLHNDYLGEDGPHLKDKIGRISAAWKPSDTISVNARVDVGHMRDNNTFETQVINCPPDSIYGPARGACARYLANNGGKVDDRLDYHASSNPSFFNYDFVEAEISTVISAGDNSLTLTSGYFHHKYENFIDPIGIPAPSGSVLGTTGDLPSDLNERFEQFSQEARFQSDDTLPITYMAGAYYAHTKLRIDNAVGFDFAPFGAATRGALPPTARVATMIFNSENSDTMSVFGSTTIKFTSRLRANLGARYSNVDKHDGRTAQMGTSSTASGIGGFVPGTPAQQALLFAILGIDSGDFDQTHRSDHKFMPTASLQYDVTRDIMAYASYNKGFKAGGFSALTSKAIFSPETVDAYEVGLKSSLFDRHVTLNVAAFLSKYNNLQETTTIPLASGAIVQRVANVAKSTAKGVELGLSWHVTSQLTLSSDVAYLHSIYDRYPNAPCTALQALASTICVQDLGGKPRAFAPKYSGNVAISYTQPVTDRLDARFDVSTYFSSYFYQQPNADPLLIQPAYAKLDARVSIGPADRRWEVAVIGKNLTNKITASYRQQTSTSPGSVQALVEPARSIGFQASFRY